jgi:hypothetical protein
MRIATYNIHACIGADGRFDPDRTVRVMRQLNAEVLALQEVEHQRVEAIDLLDYLATVTRMTAIAGPTLLRETRDYGNALLTRFPVLTLNRVDLSLPQREPGLHWMPCSTGTGNACRSLRHILVCAPASDACRCAACSPCMNQHLRCFPCCSATSMNGYYGDGRRAGCAGTSQPRRSRAPTLTGFRCSRWTGYGYIRAAP